MGRICHQEVEVVLRFQLILDEKRVIDLGYIFQILMTVPGRFRSRKMNQCLFSHDMISFHFNVTAK